MKEQAHQFIQCVIQPVLGKMGMWSVSAQQLLIATAVYESQLQYLTQLNNGPARGYYQMEMTTLNDLYTNYLHYRPEKLELLNTFLIPEMSREENLTTNLAYSTACARLQYYRRKESLPISKDMMGHWHYYKKYWNSSLGKATELGFIETWQTWGL